MDSKMNQQKALDAALAVVEGERESLWTSNFEN